MGSQHRSSTPAHSSIRFRDRGMGSRTCRGRFRSLQKSSTAPYQHSPPVSQKSRLSAFPASGKAQRFSSIPVGDWWMRVIPAKNSPRTTPGQNIFFSSFRARTVPKPAARHKRPRISSPIFPPDRL